jgi:hypothetical protein
MCFTSLQRWCFVGALRVLRREAAQTQMSVFRLLIHLIPVSM